MKKPDDIGPAEEASLASEISSGAGGSVGAVHGGWIFAGFLFVFLWAVAHVAILYLSFAGGLLIDLMLQLMKTAMVPGLVIQSPGMETAWVLPLQAGLIISGCAGIPAGLAFFWRGRRPLLIGIFSAGFLLGMGFLVYAIYRLFSDSLGGLAG